MSNMLVPTETASNALALQSKSTNKRTRQKLVKTVDKGSKGRFKYINSLDALKEIEKNWYIAKYHEHLESIRVDGNWISGAVSLSVFNEDGVIKEITRTGSIEHVINKEGKILISPTKVVFQDALKRCAVGLGLFRDVYGTIDIEDTYNELPPLEEQEQFINEVLRVVMANPDVKLTQIMNVITTYTSKQESLANLINRFNGI